MWLRLVGFALSMLIIAWMFHTMHGSNTQVQKAVDNNPTVKEQKKVLHDATGVDPNDPEAVRKYTIEQAKKIDEYQHSADGLDK
jgi:hypothetical protein